MVRGAIFFFSFPIEFVIDKDLKKMTQFPRIQSLKLRDSSISSEGFKQLAAFSSLRILALSNQNVDSEGCKVIAYLKGLTSLKLHDCTMRDRGLETLISLEKLVDLDLSYNDCTGKVLENFLNGFKGSELKNLNVSRNRLGDSVVKCLCMNRKFWNLKKLNLNFNNISDEGATYLAHTNFSNLEDLDLGFNSVSNQGVLKLSKGLFAHSLISLTLIGNDVTFDDVRSLFNHFPKLIIMQYDFPLDVCVDSTTNEWEMDLDDYDFFDTF
ncbi:predicted protein [Naegleria gruberi]|uniref:Predicted protein n=1 Tax=Naegleria gruberi TaxID=5762 RepID=D2VPS4_NAEGR|nr:uncharacterized protein NAEGRDRAFT_70966 [Naegleria gruberi]EFC41256.1 predicted protein [Naegleria gruberi]|eukprot:XP_002674000.1 predicted protein [Naegleria gruberi strain NEG-M]